MKIYYDIQPECEAMPETNFVKLVKDWYFCIDNKKIWIPKDYYYNGASIPRIFWSIIGSPFEPDFWSAAMGHDYLYLLHLVDRSTADECLYQLLLQSNVNTIRAHIIWAAVRTCGMLAWNNDSSDKLEIDTLLKELSLRKDRDKFLNIQVV
jgi:hypothetical protein